jgi:hypothetical protein
VPSFSRLVAASAFALTLSVAPIASYAQEVPAPDAGVPAIGASVAPLDKDNCPADYPVKGNNSGRQEERLVDPIYHVPGSRWYAVTDPEECFAKAADAEAAGYRAPLR